MSKPEPVRTKEPGSKFRRGIVNASGKTRQKLAAVEQKLANERRNVDCGEKVFTDDSSKNIDADASHAELLKKVLSQQKEAVASKRMSRVKATRPNVPNDSEVDLSGADNTGEAAVTAGSRNDSRKNSTRLNENSLNREKRKLSPSNLSGVTGHTGEEIIVNGHSALELHSSGARPATSTNCSSRECQVDTQESSGNETLVDDEGEVEVPLVAARQNATFPSEPGATSSAAEMPDEAAESEKEPSEKSIPEKGDNSSNPFSGSSSSRSEIPTPVLSRRSTSTKMNEVSKPALSSASSAASNGPTPASGDTLTGSPMPTLVDDKDCLTHNSKRNSPVSSAVNLVCEIEPPTEHEAENGEVQGQTSAAESGQGVPDHHALPLEKEGVDPQKPEEEEQVQEVPPLLSAEESNARIQTLIAAEKQASDPCDKTASVDDKIPEKRDSQIEPRNQGSRDQEQQLEARTQATFTVRENEIEHADHVQKSIVEPVLRANSTSDGGNESKSGAKDQRRQSSRLASIEACKKLDQSNSSLRRTRSVSPLPQEGATQKQSGEGGSKKDKSKDTDNLRGTDGGEISDSNTSITAPTGTSTPIHMGKAPPFTFPRRISHIPRFFDKNPVVVTPAPPVPMLSTGHHPQHNVSSTSSGSQTSQGGRRKLNSKKPVVLDEEDEDKNRPGPEFEDNKPPPTVAETFLMDFPEPDPLTADKINRIPIREATSEEDEWLTEGQVTIVPLSSESKKLHKSPKGQKERNNNTKITSPRISNIDSAGSTAESECGSSTTKRRSKQSPVRTESNSGQRIGQKRAPAQVENSLRVKALKTCAAKRKSDGSLRRSVSFAEPPVECEQNSSNSRGHSRSLRSGSGTTSSSQESPLSKRKRVSPSSEHVKPSFILTQPSPSPKKRRKRLREDEDSSKAGTSLTNGKGCTSRSGYRHYFQTTGGDCDVTDGDDSEEEGYGSLDKSIYYKSQLPEPKLVKHSEEEVEESQLRRSRRTRCPRLIPELGQRLVYRIDKEGNRVIDHVACKKITNPTQLKYGVAYGPNLEAKRRVDQIKKALGKKGKETKGKRKKGLSFHVPVEEMVSIKEREMEGELDGFLELPDALNKNKPKRFYCYYRESKSDFEHLDILNHDGHAVAENDDVTWMTLFKYGTQSYSGILTLRAFAEKPVHSSSASFSTGTVQKGRVKVTVEDVSFDLQEGQAFTVPIGVKYSVKNLRRDEAKIFMVSIKSTK